MQVHLFSPCGRGVIWAWFGVEIVMGPLAHEIYYANSLEFEGEPQSMEG